MNADCVNMDNERLAVHLLDFRYLAKEIFSTFVKSYDKYRNEASDSC